MQSTRGYRIMSRLTALAIGSTVAMVAATGVAHANAAYNYVKPYSDFAAEIPGTYAVEAVFTSTAPASDPLNPASGRKGIASYGDVFLTSNGNGLITALPGSQLFSDRLYPSGAPFDSSRADQSGLQIDLNDARQTVSVSLVLLSWGDTLVKLQHPRVSDGMLIADGPGVSPGTNAVFAFALDALYEIHT